MAFAVAAPSCWLLMRDRNSMTLVQSARRTVTIAGFPPSAWAFALRIWAAMMVGLYAAFWLQLESASSAAVTVRHSRLADAGTGLPKGSPFGMDQLLRSLLRQNGPPGWTSRTIGLRPEWRNMRMPALRLTELLPTSRRSTPSSPPFLRASIMS
jgi:hypothetical protein